MIRKTLTFCAALCLVASLSQAAGYSPIYSTSLSIGAQGRWLDQGGISGDRDIEGTANAAVSLTPHVSVTAGGAYGVKGSYMRGQVDARLTASDVNDPNFNVWVGVGRYFSKRSSDGLDEAAGKAGVGWRPINSGPIVVGVAAAYGLDTERRMVSVSVSYLLKATKGGEQ